MTTEATRVLEDALRLAENERAEIAAKLLNSLDEGAEDDWDAEWADEIKRRIEEVERGEVRTIPWSEARRLLMSDDESDKA